jgi:hypothetical protein
MTIGMAYTYSSLLVCFRASRVEIIMFICAKQSWFRRVAVTATALATVALCIGPLAQSATAQGYNPGYTSAPSQTYPGYSSPGYSYQAPAAPAQGYAGYGYSGAYPGYGYSGAYPGYGYSEAYPGYGYSGAYPYYPYPYWGWAGWGWPGWGWGWPGISVGWGWGGWWGGRGCWNCGFHGGFRGGFAHAGFRGGGFHGGGGGFHR